MDLLKKIERDELRDRVPLSQGIWKMMECETIVVQEDAKAPFIAQYDVFPDLFRCLRQTGFCRSKQIQNGLANKASRHTV